MRTKLKGLNHGWRLFVALALVFSMVPALAVSMAGTAGAVANGAVAYGSDFILHEAGGTGEARWVWDNILEPDPPGTIDDFHSSNHAAYLKALNEGDSAGVIVTWGCTIGEIKVLSYWHRETMKDLGPGMGLFIDTNHDGQPDYYAVVNPCPPNAPVWTKWSEDFSTAHWDLHKISPPGWTSGLTWGGMVSIVGSDAKVVAVGVGYNYYWQGYETCRGEALVDDIVVNGRTWDLEPIPDADCVKSELFPGFIQAGYPIQIEVDDMSANVEGHEVLELSTTDPDGIEDTFALAHAPKSVGTTFAYDLGGPLTVTAVAQTPTGGTVTVSETPPAAYQVFPLILDCAHAEADMNPSVITLTTPTQLTVTSTNHIADGDATNDPDCNPTAPGPGMWMYVFISGYTGTGSSGTPINELLYILGDTMTTATTTQTFGTIIAEGIDATYSTGSAATALFISADNHVWVTYDWHQADTVTVYAQLKGETPIEVELIEVNSSTLEPDKDSGYFKGILYPVTTGNVDPDPDPPTGLERHELNAPHCSTIELKYPDPITDDIFATFKVDNMPPEMSNMSPDPSTNLSLPLISVDIVDAKCPVREESIRFFFDGTEYFNFEWDGTTLTWTPASTLTDGTYCVGLKFADCCWNWAQDGWCFEVESSPPMMIDAITGWGWNWRFHMPQNRNVRTSIMVVFSEPLNPMTVEASDFRVNNIQPVDVEYHDYSGSWPGNCDGSHEYGLVFLYLATPLATDATPTVKQYGVVEDLAGNPCDKYYEWLCPLDPATLNYLNDPPPQEVIAQDGIAPAITVTASPEEPGYNETVTVTATSSEPLSAAYLFVGNGLPWDYNWDQCKPIGWNASGPDMGPDIPCSATGHVPSTAWDGKKCDGGEWMLMTEGATPYVWTASFTNEFAEMGQWFAEVAAHDNTQWWVDMTEPDPGVWYDYECVEHEKRWKHEKWTQESLLFWRVDVLTLELCEGWNLISVPDKLTDPTPLGVFGSRQQGVTKVYHYTGGQYGTWQYTALNPVTGMWTGTITSIVPGKAYWVWVSPPWMNLTFFIAPRDAIDVPPAIALKKGWNMVGFVDISHCSFGPMPWMWCWSSARYYFASIATVELQSVMWEYRACYARWLGTALWPPGQSEFWETHDVWVGPGQGYWVSVSEDRTLYPTVGEVEEPWW